LDNLFTTTHDLYDVCDFCILRWRDFFVCSDSILQFSELSGWYMLQFLTRYKTRWINLLWNILQEYFILSNHWISAQPIMAWAHAEKKLRRIRRSWSKLWVAKPFIDVDAQIGRHKLYRPNKNFYTMKNCLISSHPVEGMLLPNLSTSSSLNFIKLHLNSGPGAGTDCDKWWTKNLVRNVTSL